MIRRIEWGVAVAAIAAILFLHLSFLGHAGALWRDEANSVNLASMSPREFGENLQFDSFPVFWFAVLRAWIALGPGSSDLGLRILGLLLGVGVLASLIWNSRRFWSAPPLIGMALLGCSAAVIAYGDSVRGYGLGMLTGLLSLGALFALANRPGPRTLAFAAVSSLLSVHALYYNAAIVLAGCAGGAALALKRKEPRTVVLMGATGLVTALSLLVYAGTIRSQQSWNFLVKRDVGLAWIWTKFVEATSSTAPAFPWIWVASAALALSVAALVLLRPSAGIPEARRDAVLFCGVALATGVLAYVAFLLKLSYLMQPWYFLALLALVGSTVDGILVPAEGSASLRLSRAAAAAVLVGLSFRGTWSMTHVRKTNLDRVAATLRAEAGATDFIVVSPWYCGIPFARYYDGPAAWATLPPLNEHRVHRYDLLTHAMKDPDAMAPVLARIESTLRSGGRVFWVGGLSVPPEGTLPPRLPPPEQAAWGWSEGPYYEGWTLQAGHLLQSRAARAQRVIVQNDGPVSPFEDLPVTRIEGWRGPSP